MRLDLASRTVVPLPAGNSPLEIAPAAGGAVLTVTEDGTLHKIDPTTGTVVGMNDAMAAFAGQHGRRWRAERDLEDFFNLSPDSLCILGFDGYFEGVQLRSCSQRRGLT